MGDRSRRYLHDAYWRPPYFGARTNILNASELVVVKCHVCRAFVDCTGPDIARHAKFHAPEL